MAGVLQIYSQLIMLEMLKIAENIILVHRWTQIT